MFFIKKCYVNVGAGIDVKSIIHDVKYAIRDSKSPEGLLTVVVPQTGAGLIVVPNIKEVLDEIKITMEMYGAEAGEAKDKLKRDREVASIVQSAFLGRTIHLPFKEGKLLIDPYDEVFLVDFQKKGARREFIIQIISEAPAENEQGRGGGRRG